MDISTALSSLSAAVGLAKSAMEARDESKANAAIAQLTEKHLALSMATIELIEKHNALLASHHDLKAELSEIQRKLGEKENYSLYQLAPGRWVYRFNDPNGASDDVHYLCQICYDKGVKSVLRLYSGNQISSRNYACAAVDNRSHNIHF